MINLNELQAKIGAILNGTDSETSGVTNPLSNYEFRVLTYATHLDSIANKTNKNNVIPVYIANQQGTIEPIPNLGEIGLTYDIYFYFPVQFKDDFFKLSAFLINVFVGKILSYGTLSGKGLSNLSVPNFGEIESNSFIQFADWVAKSYDLPISKTDRYGVMSFNLYVSQYANLGSENGFILGNQVANTISFTYGGTTYSEDCVYATSTRNMTADPVSQQLLTDLETKGLVKNSNYIDSIQVYMRDNAFWRKVLDLFEDGLLQNQSFTYTKTYNLPSGTKTYTKSMFLSNLPSSNDLGKLKTFTFTFVKKASI